MRSFAIARFEQVVSETVVRSELLRKLLDDMHVDVKARGLRACAADAACSVRTKASESADTAKVHAKAAFVHAGEVASRPSVQTSAAGAVAGGTALGVAGAATGVVAGGVVGGLAGVPLALFTFGLSIPACAVMGGVAGLSLGAVSGTTVGMASGGALGYTGYQKKGEIRDAGAVAVSKATEGAEFVKGRALASAQYARETIAATKEKLKRAGTGGTVEATD